MKLFRNSICRGLSHRTIIELALPNVSTAREFFTRISCFRFLSFKRTLSLTMSSLYYYLTFYYLLPSFAASLALNIPQSSNHPTTLTKPSLLLPSSNTSAAADNSTIKDVLLLNPNSTTILTTGKIECDERRFGNPPAASCLDAIGQMPQDPATVIRNPDRSYGPRSHGTWDVGLPKRYISCERFL